MPSDVNVLLVSPAGGTVLLMSHTGGGYSVTNLTLTFDDASTNTLPNTDPLGQCGYRGHNNPATPDPSKTAYDGQPVCSGSSADFNNNVVFDAVRLMRHRIDFGLQMRYQMIHLGVHAITDLVSAAAANTDKVSVRDPSDPSGRTQLSLNKYEDDPRTEGDDAVGKQWTVAFEVGAQF